MAPEGATAVVLPETVVLPEAEACTGELAVEPAIKEALYCAVSLAQGGDCDEALDVIKCECAQAPASAVAAAYHAVLEGFLRQERVEAAFNLVMEMLRPGAGECQILPASQDIVLRALVQTQQHTRAAEVLRALCSAGVTPPGDAVFNGVVDAAVRARAYGEAWDVLELLLTHRRRADKYFVSILTKSLETSSDKRWVRRGISLVDRFIEQQREDVDEIVFNSLLNVLGHVGDMLKLQQTLSKMTEYGVPPSAVTYGTVVKAYGRARDIDAVLKVWNDMRGRCLGVNPVTCGCVLDACVKCGHLDKAMAIFQEMRLQGLHKNTVLYATLIKGLAKVRDLVCAVHLYQEMRVEGVPCNLVTFNSLMDVCVRCGDLQTAALFLQDMMQMGIEPDLITFSTLIKGYSHTGEVHKALALSKELKSRGLKCDEIMYNSLIDGCAKANKVQEGLLVFEDMLHSRVSPSNITFSILVKLHFEAGQAPEAFRLVDEMAGRYRCAPSRIVYTVLLRCCAQHGGAALARGAALLSELATKRNSKMPDQGMVGAVISGCAQHSDFETAARLVRDFTASSARRGSSMVPLDCLKGLFEELGAQDEIRGQELLEYLRRKSLPAAHVMQLQAALADGKRRSGGGDAGGGGNGGVPNPATRTHLSTIMPLGPSTRGVASPVPLEPYCQWSQPATFTPQPFPGQDFFQPYHPQPFSPQLGYYGGYPNVPFVGGDDFCVASSEGPLSMPPSPPPLAPAAPAPQRSFADKENAAPVGQAKENHDPQQRNVPFKQRQGKRQQRDPNMIAMQPNMRFGT